MANLTAGPARALADTNLSLHFGQRIRGQRRSTRLGEQGIARADHSTNCTTQSVTRAQLSHWSVRHADRTAPDFQYRLSSVQEESRTRHFSVSVIVQECGKSL